jgi:hypothetical protein
MKTLNSTDHNILSHRALDRTRPMDTSIFKKTNANRTKGISEYCDVERPTHPRLNVDHAKALQDDPLVFNRKDGIFTHLYNSAARLHVEKPFGFEDK